MIFEAVEATGSLGRWAEVLFDLFARICVLQTINLIEAWSSIEGIVTEPALTYGCWILASIATASTTMTLHTR
jgi:hypothetical protein